MKNRAGHGRGHPPQEDTGSLFTGYFSSEASLVRYKTRKKVLEQNALKYKNVSLALNELELREIVRSP